ncbi:helix-turn-helix transcriptional regulator [Eggerthella sp. YY7918]|uniref:helix-turn-helix transcriptional regulator n=1 Tax=Eggerthella sp. (strain YY7918) TaxID=502558 RepID=UPI00059EE80C|nr:helix-turn-helix transcriptional regulator [Eggerthella sp. YY7918]
MYAEGAAEFSSQPHSSYMAFDFVTAFVLVVLAALSYHVAPLYRRRFVMPLTALLLVVCTLLNFLPVFSPANSYVSMNAIAIVFGAVGIALYLMLWSELYGCIGPLKVALYYAAGIMVSALVLWVLKSTSLICLFVCMCVLPIILMISLWRAYAHLSLDDVPKAPVAKSSFPWKPALAMAVYAFARGMQVSLSSDDVGASSSIGFFGGALLVYIGIAWKREDFNFSSLWKIAMPLMLLSLFPWGRFLPFGSTLSGTLSLAAYALMLILMMSILGNISYRYGVCALWLFAIERATRLVAVQLGELWGGNLGAATMLSPEASQIVANVVFVVLIVITALMFASERQIDSSWGIILKMPISRDTSLALAKTRLGVRCHELAQSYELTAREEEILLLIFQQNKPRDIARILQIELNTVNTHIKHVYQKLGTHSRKETLALLGIE